MSIGSKPGSAVLSPPYAGETVWRPVRRGRSSWPASSKSSASAAHSFRSYPRATPPSSPARSRPPSTIYAGSSSFLATPGSADACGGIEGAAAFRADKNVFKDYCGDNTAAAHAYWSQRETARPLIEYLLIPPVTVLEEVAGA